MVFRLPENILLGKKHEKIAEIHGRLLFAAVAFIVLGGLLGYFSYQNDARQEPSFTVSGSPDVLRER